MGKDETCIEDLPNELLSQILACLSLKHDLDNVQRVSRRWHAVVDETIGRDISITSIASQFDSNCIVHLGCLGFNMISQMGVKTCYVDLTHCSSSDQSRAEANDSEEDDVCRENGPLLAFKYPHLLKQLYMNGSIRPDCFECLLRDTYNLSMFQVNLLALSQLGSEDLKNLKLPQLKALGVGKCVKACGRNFDDTFGLANLHTLLEHNTFPTLRQLDLRFPIKNSIDFSTISVVLNFIGKHGRLKELSIIMEFPVEINNLQHDALLKEQLCTAISLARKQSTKCRSLQICEVQGIRLHAGYPQLKIWMAFLELQTCLKTLTLRLGQLPAPFLEQLCRGNESTLEHLFLYKLNEMMDMDEEEELVYLGLRRLAVLDCASFSQAKRLVTLYALGSDLVINAKKLPGSSLSTLFLTGAIPSPDAEHILLYHPQLQFISLRNACMGKEGCGVGLDLLNKVIQSRKVNRVILNGASLSQAYPTQGLPNGDPENPERLRQFDNWDPDEVYLDWQLNTDNYYIDKAY